MKDISNIPLYVLRGDLEEALSLGATQVVGDLRLYPPARLMSEAEQTVFLRWQGSRARYAWCMELVRDVLSGVNGGVDPLATMMSLMDEDGYKDRVYLWATPLDSVALSAINGVKWDRSVRRYFVSRDVDMNLVFAWLTPESRIVWETHESSRLALDALVRERAQIEASSSGSGSGGAIPASGAIQRNNRSPDSR